MYLFHICVFDTSGTLLLFLLVVDVRSLSGVKEPVVRCHVAHHVVFIHFVRRNFLFFFGVEAEMFVVWALWFAADGLIGGKNKDER